MIDPIHNLMKSAGAAFRLSGVAFFKGNETVADDWEAIGLACRRQAELMANAEAMEILRKQD